MTNPNIPSNPPGPPPVWANSGGYGGYNIQPSPWPQGYTPGSDPWFLHQWVLANSDIDSGPDPLYLEFLETGDRDMFNANWTFGNEPGSDFDALAGIDVSSGYWDPGSGGFGGFGGTGGFAGSGGSGGFGLGIPGGYGGYIPLGRSTIGSTYGTPGGPAPSRSGVSEFFLGTPADTSLLNESQRRILNNMLLPLGADFAGGIPSDLIERFPVFSEPVPGLSDLQRMSLAGFEALGRGEIPESASAVYQQAEETLRTFLSGDSQEFDDFFDNVIAAPLLETLEEDIFPQFRREQVATGNLKGAGSQQGIEDITENAFDALALERARTGFEVPLQALGLVPGFERIQPDLLSTLFDAGSGVRDVAVEQYAGRLAGFQRILKEREDRLNYLFDTVTGRTRSPSAAEPGLIAGLTGSNQAGVSGAGQVLGELASGVVGEILGGLFD